MSKNKRTSWMGCRLRPVWSLLHRIFASRPKTGVLLLLLMRALIDSQTAQGAEADPSLVNGSFEDALTGWSQTGFVEALGPPRTSMPIGTEGARSAALGTFGVANSSISQSLAVKPGASYELRFDLLASALGTGGITASVEARVW